VWGTQQVQPVPRCAKYDGVFAMWYGKGPGVDRCGDVFRHANAAGTSQARRRAGDRRRRPRGQVLDLPHQTEHVFKAMMMPVLAPAGVQEYLDYGLHGWAMSRYSGCWVAFKALADTVETSASVDVDPLACEIRIPTTSSCRRRRQHPLARSAAGAGAPPAAPQALRRAGLLPRQQAQPHRHRQPAPARWASSPAARAYLDVRQALDDLGIDDRLAAEIGLRLYKVGMVWPLEPRACAFAEGLEEILVVEEKRQFIEYQLKEELYNWREDVRPRVIGKFDEKGEWALPHADWLLPPPAS
jgi:indolepyruvate ferredoxin oxidoreductase